MDKDVKKNLTEKKTTMGWQ